MSKMLQIPRGEVPATSTILTAFVDVQKAYLPWVVCAWNDRFDGHIVDYGTWPDQGLPYFERAKAKKTLARAFPNTTRAEHLYQGLNALTKDLLGRAWEVESETKRRPELSIDLLLIDAGFDTDTVIQFCREQRNPRIMPSRGDGLKPSDTPIPERTAKEGQRLGMHWMIHVPRHRSIRQLFVDTNRWKSRVADGLAAEKGAPCTITLPLTQRRSLRVLLDQLTAEYPVSTEARGRRLDMWRLKVGRENDLWDGLVGCAVAASVRGLKRARQDPKRTRAAGRRVTGAWAG